MIFVTGATGTIGSKLIRLLQSSGQDLRALSRNPPSKMSDGVEWVEGDLADRSSLSDLIRGCERLLLLTGNVGNMVQLQKNAIRAALDAGVARIVKVSALGASDHSKSVIGVWHYVVEQVLKESGLEWTILRPHVYMQNLLDQKDSITREGHLYSPSGDAKIPMIDTRDIAAAAAECLTADGYDGQTYTLTGPRSISYGEAAGVLGKVLGRDLEYVAETEVEAFERLHAKGQPPWLIGGQLALAEYQRKGGGTDIVTDTVLTLTGREPRSIEDFAREVFAAST